MFPEPLIQLKRQANTVQHQHPLYENGIRLVFPGNAFAVRKALSDTLAALRFLDLTDNETGTVELVLAEVMNNIVEHAYAGNSDSMIKLEITATPHGLLCTLCDNGRPMPNGIAPLGSCPSSVGDVSGLPEGGFGWFLIRDLVHDLEYTRHDEKNLLRFRIAVGLQQFQT